MSHRKKLNNSDYIKLVTKYSGRCIICQYEEKKPTNYIFEIAHIVPRHLYKNFYENDLHKDSINNSVPLCHNHHKENEGPSFISKFNRIDSNLSKRPYLENFSEQLEQLLDEHKDSDDKLASRIFDIYTHHKLQSYDLANCMIIESNIQQRRGNFNNSLNILYIVNRLLRNNKNPKLQVKLELAYASTLRWLGFISASIEYSKSALKISKEYKLKETVEATLSLIETLLFNNRDLKTAKNLIDSISNLNTKKLPFGKILTNQIDAYSAGLISDRSKAKLIYSSALEDSGTDRDAIIRRSNIGQCNLSLNNLDEAESNFEEVILSMKESHSNYHIARNASLLAAAKLLKLGNNLSTSKTSIDDIKSTYEDALNYIDNCNIDSLYIPIAKNLREIYHIENKKEEYLKINNEITMKTYATVTRFDNAYIGGGHNIPPLPYHFMNKSKNRSKLWKIIISHHPVPDKSIAKDLTCFISKKYT